MPPPNAVATISARLSEETDGEFARGPMRRAGHRLAAFAPEARETSQDLRRFLHDHVYFAEPLVSDREKSAVMVGRLFDYFIEQPDKLPENYVDEIMGGL